MIYFCTEEYIKNNTPITQNVDARDIGPHLQTSSETYIMSVLGYNFYNDILTKFNNNTLNSDESILVDFIKPVVAFYAAYDAVVSVTYRISNKGVQSQSGTFSASESVEVLDYVRRNIIKIASGKRKILINYLEENKNLYPDYKNDNDDISKPNSNKKNSGITSI